MRIIRIAPQAAETIRNRMDVASIHSTTKTAASFDKYLQDPDDVQWTDPRKPKQKANPHAPKPRTPPPPPQGTEMAIRLEDDYFIPAVEKLYHQLKRNDPNPILVDYVRKPFEYDPHAHVSDHALQRYYQRAILKALTKADIERTDPQAVKAMQNPSIRRECWDRVKEILATASPVEDIDIHLLVKKNLDNRKTPDPQLYVSNGTWAIPISKKHGNQKAVTVYPLSFLTGLESRVASSDWDIVITSQTANEEADAKYRTYLEAHLKIKIRGIITEHLASAERTMSVTKTIVTRYIKDVVIEPKLVKGTVTVLDMTVLFYHCGDITKKRLAQALEISREGMAKSIQDLVGIRPNIKFIMTSARFGTNFASQ